MLIEREQYLEDIEEQYKNVREKSNGQGLSIDQMTGEIGSLETRVGESQNQIDE